MLPPKRCKNVTEPDCTVTRVAPRLTAWMHPEDLRALTPLIDAHINPDGNVRAGHTEAAASHSCLEPIESEAVPATLPLATASLILGQDLSPGGA
jgi:hypothetical protein